ncbi:hypothetical protein PoB_002461900 [Plakobranchus ocellatus]|uniref:Uncharacterized protein n=1 Tax=Plakobranchus ocellatus TaxID=259542 RepID=A0AAV3ZS00_9GAST|nr:hypothetical protein PoB_002461900 [Plakobranchus ocellatus]
MRHVGTARHMQGIFFVPIFLVVALSMLSAFGILTLLQPDRPLDGREEAEEVKVGESFMSSRRVFLAFGLFHAMKVPLTILIPFAVQFIAEMGSVERRIKPGNSLSEAEIPPGSFFVCPSVHQPAPHAGSLAGSDCILGRAASSTRCRLRPHAHDGGGQLRFRSPYEPLGQVHRRDFQSPPKTNGTACA